MITGYIIVNIMSGILFGVMDSLINANSLAVRLNAVYQPIARKSINLPAGVLIDLLYGFVMAGVFLVLYPGLPGEPGIVTGLSFAPYGMVLPRGNVGRFPVDDVRYSCQVAAVYRHCWIG